MDNRSTDLDLQVEITRLTFHNLALTAFVGAVGVSGATAAAAYSFHDSWLWALTGVMAITGLIRTALPVAFNRRKHSALTPATAERWQTVHALLNALNCCNMAASTLYNFSHHGYSMHFICTSGVFILCTAMAAGFGMKPWMTQACGLLMLGSLGYPIVRSPDRLLAWDGSAMILLFGLVYCKLVASKYALVVEQLRLKRTMSHLAEHDALTGLPNRRHFEACLAENCRRTQPFAVLFLDLDGFKKVNDAHGHAMGDALLQHVALRLKDAVQSSDIVARLGGDEFAILRQPLVSKNSTEMLAREILKKVSAPYEIDGLSIQIGTSIGIQLRRQGTTIQHGSSARPMQRSTMSNRRARETSASSSRSRPLCSPDPAPHPRIPAEVLQGAVKMRVTGWGRSLSALASRRLTCHICTSVKTCRYAGIPVRRMPLATFQ